MRLLREAELTRLKAVTVTRNCPVLQRVKQTHAVSRLAVTQQWRDEGQQARVPSRLQPLSAVRGTRLHLEDVLLRTLPRPHRAVSKIPQEADFSPCTQPAIHGHRVVPQDGSLVPQPVEPHCCLDEQREDIGGRPSPSS